MPRDGPGLGRSSGQALVHDTVHQAELAQEEAERTAMERLRLGRVSHAPQLVLQVQDEDVADLVDVLLIQGLVGGLASGSPPCRYHDGGHGGVVGRVRAARR